MTTLELLTQSIIYKTSMLVQGITNDTRSLPSMISNAEHLVAKLSSNNSSFAPLIDIWKYLKETVDAALEEQNTNHEDALVITLRLHRLSEMLTKIFTPKDSNATTTNLSHVGIMA
jgi:hypothetical protein